MTPHDSISGVGGDVSIRAQSGSKSGSVHLEGGHSSSGGSVMLF